MDERALVTALLMDTSKLALMAPAGTVTAGGTVATAELLLESVTAAPPVGALALRVTAPVEAAPLLTLAGSTLTADSVVAGVTVSGIVALLQHRGR